MIDDALALRGDVVVTEADGTTRALTVECSVGGSDITPIIQSFWVH